MRIAYLGNFSVPFSTESHVAASLESLGHEVTRLQEGAALALDVPRQAEGCDLFLWTQTYSLAEQGGTIEERFDMLDRLKGAGIPAVGFHLDRWFGLAREPQVREQPFFRCDVLFTADGGHPDEWKAEGIDHVWSPPAVYHAEAIDELRTGRYRADVAFVGSWQSYGHEEWWPYREELLNKLRSWYGTRFRTWPRGQAIRGLELNRLYASTKVVVGDSCLAGGVHHYWSDRIPETIGRGGFLIHPKVEGLKGVHPYVPTWDLGDWDYLHNIIDELLGNEPARFQLETYGQRDVRMNHTYRNRMEFVIDTLKERGLL